MQMIKLNFKPRHIPIYCSLKPLQIIKKFKQKLKFLIRYYYQTITIPSNLYYYYYVHKFSCLKTIAYQSKKSIKQSYILYFSKLKPENSFPSYSLLMHQLNTMSNIKIDEAKQ